MLTLATPMPWRRPDARMLEPAPHIGGLMNYRCGQPQYPAHSRTYMCYVKSLAYVSGPTPTQDNDNRSDTLRGVPACVPDSVLMCVYVLSCICVVVTQRRVSYPDCTVAHPVCMSLHTNWRTCYNADAAAPHPTPTHVCVVCGCFCVA